MTPTKHSRSGLIKRYQRLQDKRFTGSINASELSDLEQVKNKLNQLEAPATATLKRRTAKELAGLDRKIAGVIGKMKDLGIPNAGTSHGRPKANTASI